MEQLICCMSLHACIFFWDKEAKLSLRCQSQLTTSKFASCQRSWIFDLTYRKDGCHVCIDKGFVLTVCIDVKGGCVRRNHLLYLVFKFLEAILKGYNEPNTQNNITLVNNYVLVAITGRIMNAIYVVN